MITSTSKLLVDVHFSSNIHSRNANKILANKSYLLSKFDHSAKLLNEFKTFSTKIPEIATQMENMVKNAVKVQKLTELKEIAKQKLLGHYKTPLQGFEKMQNSSKNMPILTKMGP